MIGTGVRLSGLLLLLSTSAWAQWPGDQEIPAVRFPRVPRQAATLEAFVPKDWKLEAKATGNLNGDNLPDAALVLHMASPRNVIATSWDPSLRYDTNPRMLVVVFAGKAGGFDLAATDHKLIPRLENPNQDEPFDGATIAGGSLRLKLRLFLSAGGWEMGDWTYTLRWQAGAFKLIGFDRDVVMRNSGETEKISINYLTGRKLIETGNIANDEGGKRTIKLARKPLLALAQIGDGLTFDPDER